MTIKYVPLETLQEIMNTINQRDHFYDWTEEYEKLDNKVKTLFKIAEEEAFTREVLQWIMNN